VQKIWTIAATLAALLFWTASPARAETFALRLGVEAPLYTRDNTTGRSTSYTIGDTLQPAVDLLVSYKPFPVVAFEGELREGFTSTGTGYKRTGTAIGPGLRISLPVLPVYARASLPIHVEPSPVFVGFRAAGGLEFSLVLLSIYLEAALDFSLVGGNIATGPTTSNSVGPFDLTSVSGGAGVWFKF
jgi:hypothetical protein